MNVSQDELKTLDYVNAVSSLKQIREAVWLTPLKHVLQMTQIRGLNRPFCSLQRHPFTLASFLFQNLYQAVSGLPVNAAVRRARPGNHFHYVVLFVLSLAHHTISPIAFFILGKKWVFWRRAVTLTKLAGHVLIDKTIAYYM